MRKTLSDLTKYLKGIIHDIPKTFEIAPLYKIIADEETIRNGVLAYRDFLYQFCDCIIVDGNLYDKPKHTYSEGDCIKLKEDYPFLRDMSTLLLNIGAYSKINEYNNSLSLSGEQLLIISKNARISNMTKYFRCLTGCGIEFFGIDLDKSKTDFSKIPMLEITYPDNPAMLIGLQVMAKAQMEANKVLQQERWKDCISTIDSVFLRCDYRALGEEKITPDSLLRNITNQFSASTQDFVMSLHQRFMDLDFECRMQNGMFDETKGYYFCYCIKNKEPRDTWLVHLKVEPDYCGIRIKSKKADKYSSVIETFPPYLLKIITNGDDGCTYEPTPKGHKSMMQNTGFKFTINGEQHFKCASWCCSAVSFWIPLMDLTSEISQAIEKWIDLELSYLFKNKRS